VRNIKTDLGNLSNKALRNIKFLQNSVPEEIIEEISYKLEIKNIAKGDYVFRVGVPCKEISIISMGRVEVLISNKRQSIESYLETLYAGCVVGSYNSINYNEYSISGRALTD
jgi:CRP-like cAMP-binding protein